MNTKDKIKTAVYWIEMLKAANVKQGKGVLGNAEKGFCCLGYGCHVSGIHYAHFGHGSDELEDETGLTDWGTNACIDMNDDWGYSFLQIGQTLQDWPHDHFIDDVAAGITKHFNGVST